MTTGEVWRRIWYALNRRRVARELEEEMAVHRQMMADPRAFGNVLKLREESHDAWGWGWLDRLRQDIAGGARVLRRSPVFALTACLILSGGVGLNLTFFQLLNVTTLRPPAIVDPESLVRFSRQGRSFFSSGIPYPAADIIREHNSVLAAVMTRHRSDVVWDQDPAASLNASFVSANWFEEVGYGAVMGRVFSQELDDRADAPPVVVISHQFWRARLHSSETVIGQTIRLNERVATVIGVAPADFPDFDFDNPQLWLLIHQIDHYQPGTRFREDWRSNEMELYARLRPGVTPTAATEGLRTAVAELATSHPGIFRVDESLVPATAANNFNSARDLREIGKVASLIGALTLLVLIVASANLANFVLSHAIGRLREFSIRFALGASRGRIFRQMLAECSLLGAAGAAGGMAVAHGATRVMAAATELPPYLDFTPDWRLFAAALVFATLGMLAFGLIPAWMVSRRDLIRPIKDGGEQTSAGLSRARLRLALVCAQVAGCCALLVVAGALGRGLQQLLAGQPGFSFERSVVLNPSLPRHGIAGDAARAYWARVAEAVAANGHVHHMALAYPAPLGGTVNQSTYGADTGRLAVNVMRVDPDFFEALKIPLLAGRIFEPEEADVVIVSRRLALAMYGSLDVLGRGFPKTRPARTIVGVAGDASVLQLRASGTAEEYMPLSTADYADAVLVATTRGAADDLIKPLRDAARLADARVLPKVQPLAAAYAAKLRGPRIATTISSLIALLVLVLACLGIFGVVAYAVRIRTKEIGIRRALGADAPRVCALVTRQLIWPVSLGMAIGTALGFLAGRLLGGDPFYLAVADLTAPSTALAVFAAAACAAAIVPASRALAMDPIRALRQE